MSPTMPGGYSFTVALEDEQATQRLMAVIAGLIEPGDLMFTGSPAGVGLPRGEKLAPGDLVRIESPVIGSMEVTIQPQA